jgi:hypothetical protein
MSEPTAHEDAPPNSQAAPTPSSREAELEDRIRKLETALAERPAPHRDDDAVADRVIAKLSAIASEPRDPSSTDRVMVLASSTDPRVLVPAAPPPPEGAVLRPPEAPADPSRRRWLLTQLWSELRLVFQMYFDHRYRISRTAQFAMPGIIALLIFNYFLFSVWISIPVLSPIIERLLTLLLGVLAYKILMRETIRYREVLEYLTRYGPR